MTLREDPSFKRKSRGERRNGEEGLIFSDDPTFRLDFLTKDITKDTAVFVVEIIFGSFDLFADPDRDDGEGDDLGMGVFERGPCGQSMIFKDHHISKPWIPSQVDDSFPIGPEHILHCLERQGCKSFIMKGSLHDDFMGANAIHLIVNPFSLSFQFPLYPEGRKFVRNNS
jgi:hypothetical protein